MRSSWSWRSARGGANIPAGEALGHVWGYAVGIDLTRRDLQNEAKAAGRPWDWSKGFDRSAPCAPLIPAGVSGHPEAGRIWLSVNGSVRQQGDLSELIWPVADDDRDLQPGGGAASPAT